MIRIASTVSFAMQHKQPDAAVDSSLRRRPKQYFRSKVIQSKEAFTLIELLVVIVIIALLMAILMPVPGKAKDQSRTIGCRPNLKQYGIGMRMYLDDNDHDFPDAWTWLKSDIQVLA